jgi:hypothetical protein
MDYVLPAVPDAASLATLVHLVQDNLTTVRLGLIRLTADPNVTRRHREDAIFIYGRLIRHNDVTMAYHTNHLAAGTIPANAHP